MYSVWDRAKRFRTALAKQVLTEFIFLFSHRGCDERNKEFKEFKDIKEIKDMFRSTLIVNR